MNCADSEILLHALVDGELDAGHAREVEAHVATCPACAEQLRALRAMHEAVGTASLKLAAPASLRSRIEAALPAAPAPALAQPARPAAQPRSWRTFFGGFAVGTALSAAVAASLVIAVIRGDEERTIAGEVVTAHLRSLQAGHLTDVQTSDQHTVKPWFNGKIDVAPPVIDLTAQGFTLIGGRLDYVNGEAVASIVYQRRKHVINLFVAERLGPNAPSERLDSVQGFNVLHWTAAGLDFWAVSDIASDELKEFAQKFSAAQRNPSGPA